MDPVTVHLTWKIVAGAAYMLLEYWLGRTEKTEAGSVLAALMSVGKFLVKRKRV